MVNNRHRWLKEGIVLLAITGDFIFTSAAAAPIGNALAVILLCLFWFDRRALSGVGMRPIPALSFALLFLWLPYLVFGEEYSQPSGAPWARMVIIPVFILFLSDAFTRFVRPAVFEYALLIVLFVNLWLFFTGGLSSAFWGEFYLATGSRFSGASINPNTLAVILSLTVLIYSVRLNSASLSRSVLSGLVIVASLFVIVQTASKKGIISALLFLLVSAIFGGGQRGVARWSVNVLAFGGLGWVIVAILTNSGYGGTLDLAVGRVELMFESGDDSTTERMDMIGAGLSGFVSRPFLGHGPHAFQASYGAYAHNNYVELLYNGGMIAFAIFYSMHAYVLKRAMATKEVVVRNTVLMVVVFLLLLDVAMVSYSQTLVPVALLYCVAIIERSYNQVRVEY